MTTRQQAEQRIKIGFFIHAGIYVVIVSGLIVLNMTRHPEKFWSFWVAGGWGIGVLLHGAGVFLSARSRERMIQNTMNRMDRRAQVHGH